MTMLKHMLVDSSPLLEMIPKDWNHIAGKLLAKSKSCLILVSQKNGLTTMVDEESQARRILLLVFFLYAEILRILCMF